MPEDWGFAFGEIFYSSVGRDALIAYEREGLSCPPTLVVATDIRDGRMMTDSKEIKVSRVDVELLAYDDQEKLDTASRVLCELTNHSESQPGAVLAGNPERDGDKVLTGPEL